jgi:hypothetical protein
MALSPLADQFDGGREVFGFFDPSLIFYDGESGVTRDIKQRV